MTEQQFTTLLRVITDSRDELRGELIVKIDASDAMHHEAHQAILQAMHDVVAPIEEMMRDHEHHLTRLEHQPSH